MKRWATRAAGVAFEVAAAPYRMAVYAVAVALALPLCVLHQRALSERLIPIVDMALRPPERISEAIGG